MRQEEREWNIVCLRESLDNLEIELTDSLEEIVSKLPKLHRWWEHDPKFKGFLKDEWFTIWYV
jgi:hypothetical protein